jgi:lysophospholipase L1-like esterase
MLDLPGQPDAAVGPPPDLALPDLSVADLGSDGYIKLRDICFQNIGHPGKPLPDYDQFKATYGLHCHGTNHQDIKGVQKVVFLGDSITVGTPPTLPADYYSNRLVKQLELKFGKLEVKNCSKFGARADDLLLPPHQQILTCLPNNPEPKTTLVIITVGGNDAHNWAKDFSDGKSISEILVEVDKAVQLMRDAIEWFRNDPARFPNGVHVIFANVYEYTDGTGDLLSCPLAILAGLKGIWTEGRKAYLRVNEQFAKIAVDTKTDVIFMLENFCGHGFKAKNPNNECYRGANATTWFDFTCIHPTPKGHEEIAKMFMSVVNE